MGWNETGNATECCVSRLGKVFIIKCYHERFLDAKSISLMPAMPNAMQ
jgi:hypothetical protein